MNFHLQTYCKVWLIRKYVQQHILSDTQPWYDYNLTLKNIKKNPSKIKEIKLFNLKFQKLYKNIKKK